jgi:hypothetical protein
MTMSPSAFALVCPVCGGQVEKMGERRSRSLFACKECDCDLIVPTTAWDVAREKRERKWQVKRSSLHPLRRLFGAVAGASVASGPGTRDLLD